LLANSTEHVVRRDANSWRIEFQYRALGARATTRDIRASRSLSLALRRSTSLR
jgi:hypothetical protein